MLPLVKRISFQPSRTAKRPSSDARGIGEIEDLDVVVRAEDRVAGGHGGRVEQVDAPHFREGGQPEAWWTVGTMSTMLTGVVMIRGSISAARLDAVRPANDDRGPHAALVGGQFPGACARS